MLSINGIDTIIYFRHVKFHAQPFVCLLLAAEGTEPCQYNAVHWSVR